MYRPLKPYLKVLDSDIDGQGVFALGPIENETNLGLFHIIVEGEVIRTPLGGFVNHSENPNCVKVKIGNEFYLMTNRDIELGEEITVKYSLYKP